MSAENPSLTGEVARVIEAQGPAVAREWFSEIFPSHESVYRINPPEMAQLAAKFTHEGNADAARAVA